MPLALLGVVPRTIQLLFFLLSTLITACPQIGATRSGDKPGGQIGSMIGLVGSPDSGSAGSVGRPSGNGDSFLGGAPILATGRVANFLRPDWAYLNIGPTPYLCNGSPGYSAAIYTDSDGLHRVGDSCDPEKLPLDRDALYAPKFDDRVVFYEGLPYQAFALVGPFTPGRFSVDVPLVVGYGVGATSEGGSFSVILYRKEGQFIVTAAFMIQKMRYETSNRGVAAAHQPGVDFTTRGDFNIKIDLANPVPGSNLGPTFSGNVSFNYYTPADSTPKTYDRSVNFLYLAPDLY